MRLWLICLTIAVFSLALVLISCSNDDDEDCECDCQDGENCDDDAADDDNAADDDASDDDAADDDDDDTFGASPGAEQCLDNLEAEFMPCKDICWEYEEMCDFYHCIYGCFEQMFTGALECADQYQPELDDMVDYWQCHVGCDNTFVQCLEPLDECDFDIIMICTDELQTCEAGCTTGSSIPAE